jgi:hypothetical protein
MPSIANFTIKKNDGTTDVIYTGSVGSSGLNPAVWFAPALGATAETRPEYRVHSKQIGNGGKRRVIGTYMYPYHVLNSTTGLTTVERRLMGRFEADFDPSVPSTSINEFASQFANAIAHSMTKDMMKEGQAAT